MSTTSAIAVLSAYRLAAAALVATLLAACTGTRSPPLACDAQPGATGPSSWQVVPCENADECHIHALNCCPNGYLVTDERGTPVAFASAAPGSHVPPQGGVLRFRCASHVMPEPQQSGWH